MGTTVRRIYGRREERLFLTRTKKIPRSARQACLLWQLLVFKAFESQQEDLDFDAISYAMMDRKDYLKISCEVNVDSVEVFFDAVDDRLIAFVDALIAYEIMQEFQGLAFAGYASLRFMRPSRAFGMQKHHVTCSVEVACLRDVSGGQQLVNYAVSPHAIRTSTACFIGVSTMTTRCPMWSIGTVTPWQPRRGLRCLAQCSQSPHCQRPPRRLQQRLHKTQPAS